MAALLLPAFPHKAPSPTDEPQQQKALHYCCTEEKGGRVLNNQHCARLL